MYVVLLLDLKLDLQPRPDYSLVLYGIFTSSNDKHLVFSLSTFSTVAFVMVSGPTACPHLPPNTLRTYPSASHVIYILQINYLLCSFWPSCLSFCRFSSNLRTSFQTDKGKTLFLQRFCGRPLPQASPAGVILVLSDQSFAETVPSTSRLLSFRVSGASLGRVFHN